jgi:hypothetical protein
VTLSRAFAAHLHVYLHSVSDVSLLSVDALDSMLLSESLMVDSEDALLHILLTLAHPPLLRHIQWEFVSSAAITSLCEDLTFCHPTESLWLAVADRLLQPPPPPAPEIDSLIVSDFPPLFEEFRAKRFNLLWRGSRDGFRAKEFHLRCDGRANTLTLIADTDGNVFGGFTPEKWVSGWKSKGDDSLRSFLFTLRDPHDLPPRKFALRAEWKHEAIWCISGCCPVFGYGNFCDIRINNNCNTDKYNHICIGTRFGTNWMENAWAFTFTVKEIEVFEIAD